MNRRGFLGMLFGWLGGLVFSPKRTPLAPVRPPESVTVRLCHSGQSVRMDVIYYGFSDKDMNYSCVVYG